MCALITSETEAPAGNRGSRYAHNMPGYFVWLMQHVFPHWKECRQPGVTCQPCDLLPQIIIWGQHSPGIKAHYAYILCQTAAQGVHSAHSEIISWHSPCTLLILQLLMSTQKWSTLMCEISMCLSVWVWWNIFLALVLFKYKLQNENYY